MGAMNCGPDLDLAVAKILHLEGVKPLPSYSKDPAAALRLVEHLRSTQYKVVLIGDEWYDGGLWICEIYHPLTGELLGEGRDEITYDKEHQENPSLPLAVCRAIIEYSKAIVR